MFERVYKRKVMKESAVMKKGSIKINHLKFSQEKDFSHRHIASIFTALNNVEPKGDYAFILISVKGLIDSISNLMSKI